MSDWRKEIEEVRKEVETSRETEYEGEKKQR